MNKTHVPVLAGELIELLDPQPGETAVDCTFGGGGHARLIAGRLGPEGTLIGIDRDPIAEERFHEMASEVACQTRFLRASFAEGLGERRVDEAGAALQLGSQPIEALERGRVAVDRDELALGPQALGDEPGVAAAAERAVDGDATRARVERRHELAGEHGDVDDVHVNQHGRSPP